MKNLHQPPPPPPPPPPKKGRDINTFVLNCTMTRASTLEMPSVLSCTRTTLYPMMADIAPSLRMANALVRDVIGIDC